MRFDQDLADRVRALWRALAAIGAGGFEPDGGPVPHVSLALYDDEQEVDEAAAGRLVARFAARCAATGIAFASLGVFPTAENVLFLAPVVTPTLLDLHATYHGMAAEDLGATCRAHYLPERWVPHCTLAMQGPMARVLEGLDQVAAHWMPLAGTLRSVALIRVPPLVTLAEYPLARQAHPL
jgi:2'-5' RNA ligase